MNDATVAHEIALLQEKVAELGARRADGKFEVAFGVLFDATADIFEALAGTLKAAKRKGVVDYASPLLLKGPSDKVMVVLLKEAGME